MQYRSCTFIEMVPGCFIPHISCLVSFRLRFVSFGDGIVLPRHHQWWCLGSTISSYRDLDVRQRDSRRSGSIAIVRFFFKSTTPPSFISAQGILRWIWAPCSTRTSSSRRRSTARRLRWALPLSNRLHPSILRVMRRQVPSWSSRWWTLFSLYTVWVQRTRWLLWRRLRWVYL